MPAGTWPKFSQAPAGMYITPNGWSTFIWKFLIGFFLWKPIINLTLNRVGRARGVSARRW